MQVIKEIKTKRKEVKMDMTVCQQFFPVLNLETRSEKTLTEKVGEGMWVSLPKTAINEAITTLNSEEIGAICKAHKLRKSDAKKALKVLNTLLKQTEKNSDSRVLFTL